MISGKKLALLTAAVLVPILLVAAGAALAQDDGQFFSKTDSPDPVYAGEELFYEIAVGMGDG